MLCVQSLMLACRPMFQILIHLLQNYSRSGQRVTDSVRVWACSTHCAYKHLQSISSSSASVASWKIWQYCTAALKLSHFTKNVVHVKKMRLGPKTTQWQNNALYTILRNSAEVLSFERDSNCVLHTAQSAASSNMISPSVCFPSTLQHHIYTWCQCFTIENWTHSDEWQNYRTFLPLLIVHCTKGRIIQIIYNTIIQIKLCK